MPKPLETESDETVEEVEQTAEVDEDTAEVEADQDEPEDQDESKLRKVRREAQTLRDRAKTAEARAEELARALFSARVLANGKLASPADLPFDESLLDDSDALDAAIVRLIATNPHYARRRIVGDVGQGQATVSAPQDFSSLLRS